MCGRGVARDDDGFDAFALQEIHDLAAVSKNRVRTLRTVWNASRVAEIDDAFVRELANQLPHYSETAYARIENSDWS